MRLRSLVTLLLLVSACSGDGGDPTGPYLRLDLPDDPTAAIDVRGIPYPNDVLLEGGHLRVTAATRRYPNDVLLEGGHLRVTAATLPYGERVNGDALQGALDALSAANGFGVTTADPESYQRLA